VRRACSLLAINWIMSSTIARAIASAQEPSPAANDRRALQLDLQFCMSWLMFSFARRRHFCCLSAMSSSALAPPCTILADVPSLYGNRAHPVLAQRV